MWSRSAKIKTLLAIDSAFFFLEIIVGYAVGSLALVADSFHMLNDVCSLIVALYAIRLAAREETSNKYTWGWQRAEVLGALVNGVFLLALCFSIFMEAIERFFNAKEVGNPRLVVIVGSLGLLSNIVGLFLFHDHGHSHGPSHSHAPSHSNSLSNVESALEQGRNPQPIKANGHLHPSESEPLLDDTTDSIQRIESTYTDIEEESEEDPLEELFVHPAQTRANVVRAAQQAGYGSFASNTKRPIGLGRDRSYSADVAVRPADRSSDEIARSHRSTLSVDGSDFYGSYSKRKTGSTPPKLESPSLSKLNSQNQLPVPTELDESEHSHDHGNGQVEHEHEHSHSHKESTSHPHDHGSKSSMNMKGVFLHVLGDALGNVGVIGSGLFIWLTTYSWRYYSDPLISLIITIIIFSSALPLVKSASFVLLQGTPSTVPLDELRNAILRVPGIVDVHELHVWSLSEHKLIGSVHILVESGPEFDLACTKVRSVLHKFGIHSSTIQPEILGLHVEPSVVEATRVKSTENLHNLNLSCPVQCAATCDTR